MKIAIVGLGYVGLPLAVATSKKGLDVVGVDRDSKKVAIINKKQSPIKDSKLEKELKQYPFEATINIKDAKATDIFIVCVPTPVKNDYQPNLKPLKSAVEDIGKILQKGKLVIIESTINPGVCDEIVIPLLEETSGLKAGKDFYVAHCPERINPGDTKWNVENIPRVVGAVNETGLNKAVEFYEHIVDADIKRMGSLKEAEAVKIVENCFRDVNIAFVNELAMSFSKLDIDVMNVINGAATKPFAFMPHYPGAGVGGHCIPVDPYYLIEYAKNSGFDHDFMLLARRINSKMPEFTVELMQDALNEVGLPVKNTRIALLGLAYKPNVDDDRESPAYKLQQLLKDMGADVIAFDPHLLDKSDVKSLGQALEGTQAILVATAHNEFKDLDPKTLKSAGVKVVVDGRNCLDKYRLEKIGLVYKGIGT